MPGPCYDLQELLTQLGIGEAVVTVLSEIGAPTPVAWTRMFAPQSLMAPSPDAEIDATVSGSSIRSRYAEVIDRESAYEMLNVRLQQAPAPAPQQAERPAPRVREDKGMLQQVTGSPVFRSMMRSAGSALGREITRSLFGTARRRR